MPADNEDEVLVVDVDVRLLVPEACDVVDLLDGLPGALWVEDLRLPVLGIIWRGLSSKCGNKTRALDFS